jgi:hypothetical protein
MSIKPRKRKSVSEDMQRALESVRKPKLHKISLFIEANDIKEMKRRALEEDTTLTDIFQKLVKGYLSE